MSIDNKIKKLFPDIISHNIYEKYSKKFIELKTEVEWNESTSTAFQNIILDRNPFGYGGPYDFKCIKINENLFTVAWNCYDVAD